VNSPQERLTALKERFYEPGRLDFYMAAPGVVAARIESDRASASVALVGATVISYAPSGFGETLFLSGVGNFLPGKAIRGGIPLCWPWFGANPRDASLPPHGFFRLLEWEVREAFHDSLGSSVTLSLRDSEGSRKYWPHGFEAVCRVSLGDRLGVSIRIANDSQEAWDLSGAFHPYLRVADIGAAGIPSFGGEDYIDNTAPDSTEARKTQSGVLRFAGEINRVYDHAGPVDVDDPGEGRLVSVRGDSLESVGIWTPWREKCAAAPDLDGNDYTKFLCVEPGIIPPRTRRIGPGCAFEAGITVSVSRLE